MRSEESEVSGGEGERLCPGGHFVNIQRRTLIIMCMFMSHELLFISA